MTPDRIKELRRLLGDAVTRDEFGVRFDDPTVDKILNAAPALLDAADELATIRTLLTERLNGWAEATTPMPDQPETGPCPTLVDGVRAALDAADEMAALRTAWKPVERCDSCGIKRGEHFEAYGEPAYLRQVTEDGQQEPDRCGYWTTEPVTDEQKMIAVLTADLAALRIERDS